MNRPARILGHLPRLATLVVLATSALAAGTAHAQQYTFASFSNAQPGSFLFTPNQAGLTATFNATTTVDVTFYNQNNATTTTYNGATLKLTSTTTAGAYQDPTVVVQPIDGANNVLTITQAGTGKNLLTVDFTGAIVGFPPTTTSATLAGDASTPSSPDKVVYSSAVYSFSNTDPGKNSYSLALGNILNLIHPGGGLEQTGAGPNYFVDKFKADATGSFTVTTVPEPSTVVLMGLGLASIPAATLLRSRKTRRS